MNNLADCQRYQGIDVMQQWQRVGLVLQDCIGALHGVDRRIATKQVIEGRSQCKQIAAGIRPQSLNLLEGGILGGIPKEALFGHDVLFRTRPAFCQSKVKQDKLPLQ